MNSSPNPDTIVLVHGLWVTPRSWEAWKTHYEAQGFTVLTPAYPGFEIEVEALREHPEVIADATVPETVDYLASVVEALPHPPIIMGHSFGGLLTQMLLARGLGAAGAAINSAPTEGVRVTPLSQARSLFPALKNPANFHKAVGFTPEEWHYAFTNTISREESDRAYGRYAIPAPGHWVWAYGLLANFQPGHQETWVDYSADRAPLLFIGGSEDHIMPPSVNRSNAKHWAKSPAVTDYQEFAGRSHWTCAEPGWEAVADYALDWALQHAEPDTRRTPPESKESPA
ncbi:alpha/beta fold hydrolase [Arthrobacter sp. Sa2BUA2]|uniref:Alpha/beta fold hydrolase n=1 Tax=Arthrobacter pullicola TaxID=2762224 RepID=A0ABR8YMC4_9MICC|nr:alpha/beta fold hydrolase [Arthrobacter pullicola]MBD8045203.1 alpha/beta fold hydrolase [Arthrobacter pullicola]